MKCTNRLLPLVSLVVSASTAAAQSVAPNGAAKVDRLIEAAWKQQNIQPSAKVDDARYLRRIYLDIVGTIPSEQVVKDFLSDQSPDKRARAVDALLNDPRYVDHWTTYWDSVLMGKPAFSPVVDRQEFRRWLHAQFDQNTPWNTFVTRLITASGQNSTGPTYAEAMGLGRMARRQADTADNAQPAKPANRSNISSSINGAVNWQLKYAMTPADLSGAASKIFLGVQIQCAQCHDHKTEKWKQSDFRSFTACFLQAVPRPVGGALMFMQQKNNVRQVDLMDINFPVRANPLNGGADRILFSQFTPATLDGTTLDGPPAARRKALAAWMTSDTNPWFAQAITNRMWARFLGRGFVEPIDDFRPSNPPVIPEALNALSDDFKAHGYDLKYLIRTICATEVYQLTAAPSDSHDRENQYFDRYRLKPMDTDALLNSLVTATNFQTVLSRLPNGNLDQIKALITRQLTFLFNTDEEEAEQKEFEGTIPQALLLLNGNLTNRSVLPIPGTALSDVLAMPDDDSAKIQSLYLRTVSRPPTQDDISWWTRFLNAPRKIAFTDPPARPTPPGGGPDAARRGPGQNGVGPGPLGRAPMAPAIRRQLQRSETPKRQAYEDMFWALLNSSEFAFIH